MTDGHDQVEVSSGNVFSDLGFDEQEAQELMARSACIVRIARIKEKRSWTQAELGAAIGMPQSEVSHLLRGKVSRFSLERLLHALNALGVGVRITLTEEPNAGLLVDDRMDVKRT